jgi:hypothetical protein
MQTGTNPTQEGDERRIEGRRGCEPGVWAQEPHNPYHTKQGQCSVYNAKWELYHWRLLASWPWQGQETAVCVGCADKECVEHCRLVQRQPVPHTDVRFQAMSQS